MGKIIKTGIPGSEGITAQADESVLSDLLGVRDVLEILLGLELLEYHNKNWLAYDPKIRNEEKRSLIEYALKQLPKTSKCEHT